MATELPDYYFRIRENGAFVFRVDTQNRQRRIEMEQIAVLNTKNGEIKPQGDTPLDDADNAAINSWMEKRRAKLAARDLDKIYRTTETLNLTTHWATARASDDQLDAITDDLLLAMHDLRSVLVRKKAARVNKS